MERMQEQAKKPLHMTYRAVGSGQGQTEFLGKDSDYIPYTDFGAGDIPMSNEDWTALDSTQNSMLHIPFVLGAISVFHSVPDVPNGPGGLNLTDCVLAKIFKRDITTWDNAEILENNPNLDVEEGLRINVARRVGGSSSTKSLTQYLHKSCPDVWTEDLVGKKIDWPEGTLECDGSALMTACIRDNEGTIGYIDAGHGHNENLVEIELENYDKKFLSSKTASENGGIAAAAAALGKPDEDFSEVDLLDQPGEFTWPIVALSYLYIRKDLTYIEDPDTQALLVSFIKALYDPNFINDCIDLFGFSTVNDITREDVYFALDNDLITTSTEEFKFEAAGDENDKDHQGDYYISAKRRSFAEYERTENEGRIADLEAEVASLRSMIESMPIHVDYDDDDSNADAALGIAIASIVMWVFAIMWFGFLQKKVIHKDVDEGSLVSDINVPGTNGHGANGL